jgi:hypothetical protein
LLLPVFLEKYAKGDTYLQININNTESELNGFDELYRRIRNNIEVLGNTNNIFVIKSDTGTGKSVGLTTIFLDSGSTLENFEGTLINRTNKHDRKLDKHYDSGNPGLCMGDDDCLITEYYLKPRKILVLQPRIMNVESNATHVANCYLSQLGNIIGYKHSNSKEGMEGRLMTFSTQESFLQEFIKQYTIGEKNVNDYLSNYQMIILDEAHESTVVNELILWIFNTYHKKHTNTFFIILSATIIPQLYIKYFYNLDYTDPTESNNCIIIKGFTGERYEDNYLLAPVDNYLDEIYDRITKIINDGSADPLYERDIIVFLPGTNERKALIKKLESLENKGDIIIIGVYKDQPKEDDEIIYADWTRPHNLKGNRRIYIGTNKAETGITFPNLKYVIDSGFKNSLLYNPRLNINIHSQVGISKNNAGQRWGRVARKIGSTGYVYQMYTKSMYESLPETDHSELNTTDFEKYYPIMLMLSNDNIYKMNFFTKQLSWLTIMNYNVKLFKYNYEKFKIYYQMFSQKLHHVAWLLAGVENNCVYEMCIAIAAEELDITLQPYMKTFAVNKEEGKIYKYLGTYLPKIFFIKNLLNKNPGNNANFFINQATIKALPGKAYNADNNCQYIDDDYNINCGKSYQQYQYNTYIEMVQSLGISEDEMKKYTSLRGKILELLRKCYEKSFPLYSTNDWEKINNTINRGLIGNIAMQVKPEKINTGNLYKIKNNPSVYASIDSVVYSTLVNFDHNNDYLNNVYYNELIMKKGLVTFTDFSFAGSPA